MRGRIFAVIVIVAAPSVAQATEHSADAEKLFQEARTLTEQGRYAEACPKLEESQKLEPAVGTEFNLADCYEHVGRIASAWTRFTEVARIARAAGKTERDKSASERAAALEPRLPRLRIVVQSKSPGLELVLDGEMLAPAAWEKSLVVDPGKHTLVARAPRRRSSNHAPMAIEGRTIDVPIGELADDGTAPPPPSESMPTRKKIAIGVLAVGAGAAVAGGVLGALSLSHRSNARAACPETEFAFRCPTEEGAADWNSAVTTGNVATVAFIVAGALVAGGAALWLTAPSSNRALSNRAMRSAAPIVSW